MAKQTTVKDKVQICLDRMDNLSIREIAKKRGMTFQNVHLILSSLNGKGSKKEVHGTELDRDLCKKIFSMHYEGYSHKDISSTLDVDTKEITNLFAFVTTRKSRKLESALYPAIAKWANERDYSLSRLGNECGIAPYRLGRILAGNSNFPMTKTAAEKISNLTGIPLKEIYGELYKQGASDD